MPPDHIKSKETHKELNDMCRRNWKGKGWLGATGGFFPTKNPKPVPD